MNDTQTRQACPVCDADLDAGAGQCSNCRTDLRLFAPPSELALDFYNDGLDLARAGDRQGAIDKLRGALASDPKLIDAYIVLGKLLAQSGRTGELEQAIECWERARGFRPTGEQSRKLDHCIETADGRLRAGKQQARANRQNGSTALIAGGLILAALCGVAGYRMRPASAGTAILPGNGTTQNSAVNSPTPQSPIAAVNSVLNRPDISVLRIGDKLALNGTVQTESEKRVTLAAAAFAARVPVGTIDASGLKVKAMSTPVAAKRIEHMLHLFVAGLGRGSRDPLAGAALLVSGGSNKGPLKVMGTCTSPKAGDEVSRLVKEVYPSASPIDISGLVIRANSGMSVPPPRKLVAKSSYTVPTASQTAAAVHRAVSTSHIAPATGSAATPPSHPMARTVHTSVRPAHSVAPSGRSLPPAMPGMAKKAVVVTGGPVTNSAKAPTKMSGNQVVINLSNKAYTVQRGDTIISITQKYGHGAQWHALWKANQKVIRNPNTIPAGTILKLPQGWAPLVKPNHENQ